MQLSTLVRSSVATTDSVAPLFLRLALGAMILPHGLQKTLGWFGGYGFAGTMQYFTQSFGAPWLLALLAILAESVGGLMLLAGAGTRLAALGVGAVMAVAMTQHWQHGFFMNWFGAQQGEGIEFFILALGIAAALVVTGGGRWSVDGRVAR